MVYISKDKEMSNEQKQINRNLICKMFRHPILLVVMILPTIIIRTITSERKNQEETDIVNSIGIIGISSFGVISVFSYGFTCDVINMLKEISLRKTYLNLDEFESIIFEEDDLSNPKEIQLHLKK